MKKLLLFGVTLAIASSSANAFAASKKVSVKVFAATYECLSPFFQDSLNTEIKNLTIEISNSGAVTVTGTIAADIPGCDINDPDTETCKPERNFVASMKKLLAPKKKWAAYRSTLKKKTVDASSGLTLSGTVETFTSGRERYRSIRGTVSLGAQQGALSYNLSCSAPNTLK
jgi:hypothetical protein